MAGEPSDAPQKKRRRRRRRKSASPDLQDDTRQPDSTTKTPAERHREWDISQFQVPLADGKLRFHDLDIPDKILHAVHDLGFTYCTPIQAEILPSTLGGRDATGKAQTGTGKTAAFLITIFTRLLNTPIAEKRRPGIPRVLIMAPTRELVLQIAEEGQALAKYCDIEIVSIFGGIDYEKQRRQLSRGVVDMIVATPGRLLDFHQQHAVNLKSVEILVIDEADRMLDMGFIPDMRRIIHCTPPKAERQTLLFSATLTSEVTRLASQWTRQPVTVEIEPEQVAVDTVKQLVYIVTMEQKYALLYNILHRQNLERLLIFCNRRDETRRLSGLLQGNGVNCEMLSGEVPQKKRIRTLEDFRSGKIRVLVATDVAGRGIHIEGMDHVINYALPRDPEDYVHRIGRTGRAGASGTSISFACEEDSFYIPAIEEFIGNELPCIQPEEEWLTPPPPPKFKKKDDFRKSKPGRPNAGRRRKSSPRTPRRRPASRA